MPKWGARLWVMASLTGASIAVSPAYALQATAGTFSIRKGGGAGRN